MNKGSLVIDLESTALTAEERELIHHPGIAGVLFFARNYSDRQQLTQLVADIRSERPDLLLMVDQEGGRVQRFKKDFTILPPPGRLLRYYRRDPEKALQLIQDTGWLMASELRCCDIDLSLAPVLDMDLGLTDVVGDRAFGTTPEEVVKLSSAWMKGVAEAGMATVVKHFPGHGSVDVDSHLALPVDDRPLEEIIAGDMIPFREHVQSGVQGVMPAHIVFSAVDSEPAGFSAKWLKNILRQQLGFSGVIFSDCLTMEGAASAGSYLTRVEKALKAGCDLLLLSNRDGVREVLPSLRERQTSATDGLQLKQPSIVWGELQSLDRYLSCKDRLEHLTERFA